MFKKLALTLALTLVSATAALAANYIEPQKLKALIDKKTPVILVDIQPAADFEKQHLPGSIETNAFPAAKDEEKARLDKALTVIKASKDPVIVVCPRGKSGAKKQGQAGAIAIMTDTDNTGAEATAWYGDIILSTIR